MGYFKYNDDGILRCKKCRKIYTPTLKGQDSCVPCIMKEEPTKPKDNDSKEQPNWVNWFIYNWRCIREAAGKIEKEQDKTFK